MAMPFGLPLKYLLAMGQEGIMDCPCLIVRLEFTKKAKILATYTT
jgi:hypothetical protein